MIIVFDYCKHNRLQVLILLSYQKAYGCSEMPLLWGSSLIVFKVNNTSLFFMVFTHSTARYSTKACYCLCVCLCSCSSYVSNSLAVWIPRCPVSLDAHISWAALCPSSWTQKTPLWSVESTEDNFINFYGALYQI